jgi:dGTPase
MFIPPDGLRRDEFLLAPYALATRLSRGRQYPEPEHPFRPLFQRDRERVVHCAAFRRLMLKTQVLAAATNDHHRTRLTHTLEVAQVSRTIARQLGLQEDLTEAIALSHDLGHPPYGHAGETALDACMAGHGGFDHNLHALRTADVLESPYPDRPGLNLSWEVREAMAHHSKRRDDPTARALTAAGEPTLEARVVDAADSLAYDIHDLDDALGYDLLTLEELDGLAFWRVGAERVRTEYPGLGPARFRRAVIRALIEWQVTDLLVYTQDRLRAERVESVADVRRVPDIVGNTEPARRAKAELESFMHTRVYRHPRVRAMAECGQQWVRALFAAYLTDLAEMSPRFARRAADEPPEQVVCDYVAGMTDRYARQEYERLFPGERSV